MKRLLGCALFVILLLQGHRVLAGFTETLPRGLFLLEETYIHSRLDRAYDNAGNPVPIIEEIVRYEPGGSQQGIILSNAEVTYTILLTLLQYGLTDNLSLAVAAPLVLETRVDPKLGWTEGDYQWTLGRSYSEEDFWAWAASMGQPKPGVWTGNRGSMSDTLLGLRYRFTDGWSWFKEKELACAVTLMGAIPTGKAPNPEEIVAAGTSSWDLHSMGELGLHLSVEKFFEERFDGRLTLGIDLFYEVLLEHTYKTSSGTVHPLLLNYAPYVGASYTIDPGDFSGASLQAEIVPWKGPARGSWLTGGDKTKAEAMPPLLTVSLKYTFVYLGQSDWTSASPIWDWQREKQWRPGYKNILQGAVILSFLRLGIPLQPYLSYRTQNLIPGKNSRAADVISMGLRVPVKFW